jgi:hypothetical protein
MTGAVVILAVARNSLVAIDSEIIFGFASERPARETLTTKPRRPLNVNLERLANPIADDPIESAGLHARAIAGGLCITESIFST